MLIFFGKVSVYLLHKIGVILTFFVKYCILPHSIFGGLAGGGTYSRTYSRTFTLGPHRFWPKLPPTSFGTLSTPADSRIYFFFFEGPKGRYGPREAWAHMGWVGHPAH